MAVEPSQIEDLANYLSFGYWLDGGDRPHHYTEKLIAVDLSGLSSDGQELARGALQAWSMVADIQFVDTSTSVQISFRNDLAGAMTTSVYSLDGATETAQVNIANAWLDTYGATVGSYSFLTFLHEVGHALGLGHPGPYDGSANYLFDTRFQNDSWQCSVMSYFSQDQGTGSSASYAMPVTPMMADILAIQELYGAPQGGPSAGATSWGLGSNLGTYLDAIFEGPDAGLVGLAMTVFDEGGSDILRLSNDTHDQIVDLADGAYSSVYGGVGNLGIAFGTIIEDYVAGSGHDRVVGNASANQVALGCGNDKCWGEAGSDRLLGRGGNDRLFGGEGSDWLDGGGGQDWLAGGLGRDTFVFTGGHDTIDDFRKHADTLVLDERLWGGDLSRKEVLAHFAEVDGRGTVLDFGGSTTLRINDIHDAKLLLDDLIIL